MNDELKQDFEKHGYEVTAEAPGEITFETTKDDYFEKVDPDIHETHPIWKDEDKDNLAGSASKVIIKVACARCNQPVIDGQCPKCGRTWSVINRKPHIPYKSELGA